MTLPTDSTEPSPPTTDNTTDIANPTDIKNPSPPPGGPTPTTTTDSPTDTDTVPAAPSGPVTNKTVDPSKDADTLPSPTHSEEEPSVLSLTKSKAPKIKVVGNKIVDEDGKSFACHGIAVQGTEYQCAHGFGFGEGSGLNQDEVDNIKKWNPNCVRVGFNQDCYLGNKIPGFNNSQYIGKPYVERMTKWVDLLLANGLVVIIDLHWSAGGYVALGQVRNIDSCFLDRE